MSALCTYGWYTTHADGLTECAVCDLLAPAAEFDARHEGAATPCVIDGRPMFHEWDHACPRRAPLIKYDGGPDTLDCRYRWWPDDEPTPWWAAADPAATDAADVAAGA